MGDSHRSAGMARDHAHWQPHLALCASASKAASLSRQEARRSDRAMSSSALSAAASESRMSRWALRA